jgi:hypothetical protein
MPVLRMDMGKCPANARDVKTVGYPGILISVTRIIIINEVVSERLTKNDPSEDYETNADAHS